MRQSTHRRRSTCLKGFDYTQSGDYFVTICTKDRELLLGDVCDGLMMLSGIGEVVERCWKSIPRHFEWVRLGAYQIMPNHVHGIIRISEKAHGFAPDGASCRGLQLKTPTGVTEESLPQERTPRQKRMSAISPRKGSLGLIIRTFKAAVTTELRKGNQFLSTSVWQRNYFDHIIRDDVSHFFVEQYIEMNPLVWFLDSDHPGSSGSSLGELETVLRRKHHLEDHMLRYVLDLDLEYRGWKERTYSSVP